MDLPALWGHLHLMDRDYGGQRPGQLLSPQILPPNATRGSQTYLNGTAQCARHKPLSTQRHKIVVTRGPTVGKERKITVTRYAPAWVHAGWAASFPFALIGGRW
jgi:hypothetical protein